MIEKWQCYFNLLKWYNGHLAYPLWNFKNKKSNKTKENDKKQKE